ncbi:transposable element Tcb2 transposase [Trichonephila clavipes]|nr:transposable element Tcb2 transposase [Trichonephila clavipes]
MSRSVVQRLWDQYQSEDSVSEDLFQADHELQHTAEDRFLALSARRREPLLCRSSLQTAFKHQEEESPLLRCEIVFTMQVCMQEDQLCVRSPQRTTAKEPLMLGKRTCFLDAATMGFCKLFTDESRFTMESDSRASTDLEGTAH